MEKVRQIRNERERRGHNPLLFFLKCLKDNDARLPELIREEIPALASNVAAIIVAKKNH